MDAVYLIYIILAVSVISFSIRKAKEKWLMGILTSFLFSYPILNYDKFMIKSRYGFDIRATRLLFLALLPFVIIHFIKRLLERKKVQYDPLKYEIFLLLYLIITLIWAIIFGGTLNDNIAFFSNQLMFLFVYLSAKWRLEQKDFLLLVKLAILFGILSALVEVYQFWIDPDLFRSSIKRAAFLGFSRGSGFFIEEYDAGIFYTMLISLVYFLKPARFKKYLWIFIFSIGVFFTMHRGSWIALILTILFCESIGKKNTLSISMKISIIFIVFILAFVVIWGNKLAPISNEILNKRIKADTYSERIDLNLLIIKEIIRHPFGVGPNYSNAYNDHLYRIGFPFPKHLSKFGRAGTIHNSYLSIWMQYGILGILTFLGFLLYGIKEFKLFSNKAIDLNRICFINIVIYMIVSMSNDFSPLSWFPLIMIGITMGAAIHDRQQTNSKSWMNCPDMKYWSKAN